MSPPMTPFERFHYKSADELLARARELGIELPFSEDLSVLAEPVRIGPRTAPNRLALHPMEGCDCEPTDRPAS